MRRLMLPLVLIGSSLACFDTEPPAPPSGEEAAALLDVETHTQEGYTLVRPTGWEVLVQEKDHNVTMTKDLTTTVTSYWYPYKDNVTPEKLLHFTADVTRDQLTGAALGEMEATPLPGLPADGAPQRGLAAVGEVDAMILKMEVVLGAFIDEPRQLMVVGFLVAPPATFPEGGNVALLGQILQGLEPPADQIAAAVEKARAKEAAEAEAEVDAPEAAPEANEPEAAPEVDAPEAVSEEAAPDGGDE